MDEMKWVLIYFKIFFKRDIVVGFVGIFYSLWDYYGIFCDGGIFWNYWWKIRLVRYY